MSDIKFNCPQCGQRIICDACASGLEANCPACQTCVIVPSLAETTVTPPVIETSAGRARLSTEETPASKSRRVAVSIGVALVLVAATVLLAIKIGSSSKEGGPFQSISWQLTTSYTLKAADRSTEYSITDKGKAEGICYLVIQCSVLPEYVKKPDDEELLEHFQLVLANGETNTPSVASSSFTYGKGASASKLMEMKSTFLFQVEEASARHGGHGFAFEQYPAVLLTKKNRSTQAR